MQVLGPFIRPCVPGRYDQEVISDDRRILVALVNDYEVVVKGLGRMFEPHSDEVEVVEYNVKTSVSRPVDIALFDTFAQSPDGASSHIDDVLADPDVARVVLYSWNLDRDAVAAGMDRGVHGYVSKTLSTAELIEQLRRVKSGEYVVPDAPAPPGDGDADSPTNGDWPGREAGLTARESEIIALITTGLSNNDIARQTYLSINSVKSYIRSAYRRMGVSSRSQAVLWGVQHGLAPQAPERLHPAR